MRSSTATSRSSRPIARTFSTACRSVATRDSSSTANTPVQFRGRNLRLAGDVEGYRRGNSEGTYGLYEVPRAVVRSGVATVIDSELPKWIADDLASYTPRVIDVLPRRLGPSGVTEPTLLAAWEGPSGEGASMNGGTLKGLDPDALRRPVGARAGSRRSPTWRTGSSPMRRRISGSARASATRPRATAGSWKAVRTARDARPSSGSTRASCDAKLNELLARLLRRSRRPVATALDRSEYRANYACGASSLWSRRGPTGRLLRLHPRARRCQPRRPRADAPPNGLRRSIGLAARRTNRPRSAAGRAGLADPKAAIAACCATPESPTRLDANGVPQLQ